MKYVYADFTRSSVNYGNEVIEHATRKLLSQYFPEPAAAFDSFVEPPPPDGFDFLLIPGCTMITPGQNPGLANLSDVNYPAVCLAGSIWEPLPGKGFLLRKRVLRLRNIVPPDTSIVVRLKEPIGVRDSYTLSAVEAVGREAVYVGCPTLFLGEGGQFEPADDRYLLFSLGRGNVRSQTAAAARLAKEGPVVGICHEKGDLERFRAAGWTLPLVDYRGDVEEYLSYFRRATMVVSGRLHGALPAIAFKKPLFYFGTRDSRTTLLDDLGVQVHDRKHLRHARARASTAHNTSLIEVFRRRSHTLLGYLAKGASGNGLEGDSVDV